MSVLKTTDPCLYWGGNYCCVVVGWCAVSCRCGGRAGAVPVVFPGVPGVSGGWLCVGFPVVWGRPRQGLDPVGAVVLRVGAAACYSPTSCRMQYHRRARSSLPGSEWVRASPLGHGRRKSVIVIPGILVGCSRGFVWWVGDRMVDACVLKDRSVMRGVSPRHPSNSFVCLATLCGVVCVLPFDC